MDLQTPHITKDIIHQHPFINDSPKTLLNPNTFIPQSSMVNKIPNSQQN